ncbi:MAG: insulinase family protein [Myxococcales bacterium]|nr:insulinase family protein [Myxococcales bacterium]
MSTLRTATRLAAVVAAITLAQGCATTSHPASATPAANAQTTPEKTASEAYPTTPPPPGPATDVAFPPIHHDKLANGLQIVVVEDDALPAAYVQLVVRSGQSSDPSDMPGLSNLVAAMLDEGTRHHTSAQLAEAIEFLGADISASADADTTRLVGRSLSEHLGEVLGLMGEMATEPTFSNAELRKLKARELDRLALSDQDPSYLSRRAFYATLYGDHPYAHVDTTPAVVKRVTRHDLTSWHARYFIPNNAYLVVVGKVAPAEVHAAAEQAFGRWQPRLLERHQARTPPERKERSVLIVDRPGSVQSEIRIGNLALRRDDPSWIPLQVANQVLGGDAASRLFMDLRGKRSLTYGAYSAVGPRLDVGPFAAMAAVRTPVTVQAVQAFFDNLDAITTQPVPAPELKAAEQSLSDSFPLRISTPGRIADLVADQTLYHLPDDYWDTYRTRINAVTQAEALAAAKAFIRPDSALIVVVGEAADFADALRAYGPVTVVDTKGHVERRLPAK